MLLRPGPVLYRPASSSDLLLRSSSARFGISCRRVSAVRVGTLGSSRGERFGLFGDAGSDPGRLGLLVF